MTRVFVSSFCLFFVCLFFVLIEKSMRLHSRAQLICLDIVWSARRGYQKKMGMRRVGRHWSVRRNQLVSKQSRRQAVVVDSCETQIKTECREREKKTKKRTKLSEGNNPVEFLWQPSRTRVGALFFRLLLLLALIHFVFQLLDRLLLFLYLIWRASAEAFLRRMKDDKRGFGAHLISSFHLEIWLWYLEFFGWRMADE